MDFVTFLHNAVVGQAAQGKKHGVHQPKPRPGTGAGSGTWPGLKFSLVKVTHNGTVMLRRRNLVRSAQEVERA